MLSSGVVLVVVITVSVLFNTASSLPLSVSNSLEFGLNNKNDYVNNFPIEGEVKHEVYQVNKVNGTSSSDSTVETVTPGIGDIFYRITRTKRSCITGSNCQNWGIPQVLPAPCSKKS